MKWISQKVRAGSALICLGIIRKFHPKGKIPLRQLNLRVFG